MKKDPILPYHFWTAQALAGDVTGPVTDIRYQDNIVHQLNVTGAAVGTFYIQGCDNYSAAPLGDRIDGGTWVNITQAALNGVDEIIFDGNQLGFPYIRIIYDHTSGAGVVDGWLSSKQV